MVEIVVHSIKRSFKLKITLISSRGATSLTLHGLFEQAKYICLQLLLGPDRQKIYWSLVLRNIQIISQVGYDLPSTFWGWS